MKQEEGIGKGTPENGSEKNSTPVKEGKRRRVHHHWNEWKRQHTLHLHYEVGP